MRHTILLVALLLCGSAMARETPVMCVNPASGTRWEIRIDYDRRTVDAYAARISTSEISWKDSGGDNYTLDRKTGALTQVTPSSTGGYFLHDRCKLG